MEASPQKDEAIFRSLEFPDPERTLRSREEGLELAAVIHQGLSEEACRKPSNHRVRRACRWAEVLREGTDIPHAAHTPGLCIASIRPTLSYSLYNNLVNSQ